MWFEEINILDMIDEYGEKECKEILFSFSCPLNKDVEAFLHNKAIEFARQHIAITFLIFMVQDNQKLLVGYYTLANKFLSVPRTPLSKTIRKKMAKFSHYDEDNDCYMLPIPLIAQLGKNYTYLKGRCIEGTDLLRLACKRVMQVQRMIGGKMTYIECASNRRLYEFYTNNDFYELGRRETSSGEIEENPALVQMIRYLS